MNADTYVIIPVYNEAEVLEGVLRDVAQSFSNIICVDDGSTDASIEIIKKLGITLIQHKGNKGQGAALRSGIEAAVQNTRVQYFITFDADGQHQVSDAVKMLEFLRNNNVDVVLGSRFLGTVEDLPLIKRLVLKAAIIFSNVTTGLKLSDTHNGLRVFNRKTALKMRLTCSGMAHASEIIFRIAENKFRYAELPVTIKYSQYSNAKGQSVLNSFNILREIVAYRLAKES